MRDEINNRLDHVFEADIEVQDAEEELAECNATVAEIKKAGGKVPEADYLAMREAQQVLEAAETKSVSAHESLKEGALKYGIGGPVSRFLKALTIVKESAEKVMDCTNNVNKAEDKYAIVEYFVANEDAMGILQSQPNAGWMNLSFAERLEQLDDYTTYMI